jgi:HSP20 family protein
MPQQKIKSNGFSTVFSDFFKKDLLQEKDWFRESFSRTFPAVNIKDRQNEYLLELAVPGYEKNDIRLNLEENSLTINTETREDMTEDYTRKEFGKNPFSKSFTLPENSETEKIEARYENGVLYIRVPKREIPHKSKEINVS